MPTSSLADATEPSLDGLFHQGNKSVPVTPVSSCGALRHNEIGRLSRKGAR